MRDILNFLVVTIGTFLVSLILLLILTAIADSVVCGGEMQDSHETYECEVVYDFGTVFGMMISCFLADSNQQVVEYSQKNDRNADAIFIIATWLGKLWSLGCVFAYFKMLMPRVQPLPPMVPLPGQVPPVAPLSDQVSAEAPAKADDNDV
eukprot:CAMPEP_0194551284 /NCGR_PEP_ID=MMETSP0253-20130528/96146_1 /TAXON_ID=2966 /ORGANISM="Noctiluca scintillans" /LENGTH=149 /DNA_ID=CAMNT_0039398741 /DNA_START=408 /DNA_END=857 /DNA_ORIENTATION=-